MNILIINPNSSAEMTAAIEKTAKAFAGKDFNVECMMTPQAPEFIETYEDKALAAAGMMKIMEQYGDDYDAFVVACHCDPNLDLLKEMTKKPVVGIGEASMKLATMIGHKFSVVSTASHSIPNKEVLIRKYGLSEFLASIRVPKEEFAGCSDEKKFLEAARDAVNEDMAEVIVLGCAGLAGLDKKLQDELGVPVLDGIICALIVAAGLVKYKVSTSKIRRYNSSYSLA